MSAARTVVVGIDSSTQSTKVLRVDAATGEVISTRSAPHPEGTAVEPERWWEALVAAGGTDLAGIAAIAIGGQQHGMVALDGAGVPVFDALLWNDTRSAPQAERLTAELGAGTWAAELGVVPVASFTISKIAWLAETHPDLAARVARVMLPHDWLTWRLLGGVGEPVTDRSDASGTGYWSVPAESYRHDLVEKIFGRSVALPRVLAADEGAGRTADGVLVGPGAGDNAGAALGLGLREGEIVVSIGTSATVFTSTATRIIDPTGAIAGFADATGRQLPLLAMLNGARTMVATAALLGTDLAGLDDLAAGSTDAGGLILVPYLDGERTPNLPDATGSILGLTRENMTRPNLARAAVLGLLCSLADGIDSLRSHGVPVHKVLLIGGGAQSRSLQDAAADVFGVTVEVPVQGEYVALGAARQAAWVLSGLEEPPHWPRALERTIEPSADRAWAVAMRDSYAAAVADVYGAVVSTG